MAPKGAVCYLVGGQPVALATKAVQGASLSLQSVHHIHGGNGLSLGVLGIRHSITDHIFQEHFQHSASLFVDQARDSLDTATPSKTTDGWLGDSLDVVSQYFTKSDTREEVLVVAFYYVWWLLKEPLF